MCVYVCVCMYVCVCVAVFVVVSVFESIYLGIIINECLTKYFQQQHIINTNNSIICE